jgi:hypothetical protein
MLNSLFYLNYAEVAELVDALDLGSSIVRCESSSLSFRTTLYLNKELPKRVNSLKQQLGYRQAVRHRVLISAFRGSNPLIPATFSDSCKRVRQLEEV